MTDHLTDDELSRILAIASTELRSRKPLSIGVVRLLNTDVPRLVTELGLMRGRLSQRSALLIEMEQQLAARDAQIARLRQIVEHEEVAT